MRLPTCLLSMSLFFGATMTQLDAADGIIHVFDPDDGLVGYPGFSISAIGDVDLDGFPDLVLGAPDAMPPGTTLPVGGAYVVSGKDESIVSAAYGTSVGGFGWSVDDVGDLDQDGVPDLIAGAPGPSSSSVPGRAAVHSGNDGSLLLQLTGATAADLFGISVAGVGDVDADGFVDVLVGAPHDNDGGQGWEGVATVFSGATGLPLQSENGLTNVMVGLSVSGVGDVDLDGYDDALIGSPHASVTAIGSGTVKLVSGQTGQTIHVVHGDAQSATMGRIVFGPGDVDGDGRPDFAAIHGSGILTHDNAVRVFSGLDKSLLHQFGGTEFRADARGPAHDFDGDGRRDLLIRYPGQNLTDPTVVKLHSGLDGAVLDEWTGVYSEGFGESLASPGDVNGDGRLDVAIGEWEQNRTYVYSRHCGAIASYGAGCAPASWSVPTLELIGCATPGADLVMKGFAGSFAAPPGFLFAGGAAASIPVGGCTFLVGGPLVVAPLPSGTFGSFVLPVEVPIPFGPGSVHLQMLVPSPASRSGFAASAGLAVAFD